MDGFARDTGIEPDGPQRRYLWTDAFAVCNYLGLYRAGGEERHLRRALRLVDRVHHVLGRHREDDTQRGWISGLSDEEGEEHPTAGGLRIGKPEPERGPGEAHHPASEWDRDGQYYHYLTRWMHALVRTWSVTGDARFQRWAVELAEAAQRAFVQRTDDGRGLWWKMSIDLSRPLVPSMGQHDPLDGYVALREIRDATPTPHGGPAHHPPLEGELRELRELCSGGSWVTRDPLGTGALLVDLLFLARLEGRATGNRSAEEERRDREILSRLASAAAGSLEEFSRTREMAQPARARLAFRELGLSIGLAAVERLPDPGEGDALTPTAEEALSGLRRHLPLRKRIDAFWMDPAHQQALTWTEHGDINEVMLATVLAPGGYLDI